MLNPLKGWNQALALAAHFCLGMNSQGNFAVGVRVMIVQRPASRSGLHPTRRVPSFLGDSRSWIRLAIVLFAIVSVARAQNNEWAWISGSNTVPVNQLGVPGVYGTLGHAAAANVPGGRQDAATWTDSNGNLWLFGGNGLDSNGTQGYLNDLWEFDVSTGLWTWMGGSSTANASGDYGTQSIAFASNVPGGRDIAVTWVDSSGNLWLFGGLGYDANGVLARLNDLWEYNPATKMWTWISGSDGHDQVGVYGTLGEADPKNVPGTRELAYSWIDSKDRLWLFGGFGEDFDDVGGGCVSCYPVFLDDLWMFDPSISEWTWMGGIDTGNAGGAYSVMGQASSSNFLGSHAAGQAWTDAKGRFWLFGGEVYYDAGYFSGYLNDLWFYDPSTNEWTWTSGSGLLDQFGVYGTEGTAAQGNVPGARYGTSGWVDADGNLWLFGGAGYSVEIRPSTFCSWNDLWKFSPSNNEWTWKGGSDSVVDGDLKCASPVGMYGTQGIPAGSNLPGARYGSASWTGSDGRFWLMGGYGVDSTNQVLFNDLWVYEPVVATPVFNPAGGTYSAPQQVTIVDSTSNATIYYTTDGSTPSTSSTLYTGPIVVTDSETINAIATASGYSNSAVASAAYTINLPKVTLSPDSLTFALQTQGTTSAAQTVTLTVSGQAALNITSIAASGDFAETNTCGSSVAVGADCSISVTFTPIASGTRTGTVTITDNAGDSPQTVLLTGSGATPASVTLSPASLTFASQALGTTSAAQTVTLTNVGQSALSISSIAASGDFAETNTCGNGVAGGTSCTISVTFTPTAPGARTGTLTVTGNANGLPQMVSLSGTGTVAVAAPAVTLSLTSLTFALQTQGTTSAAQTVTLTDSGQAALSITSISASGDFAETNTCGASVAAGAKCKISVTFTPTASGTRTGTVTITDNASGSPQTVALSGTGAVPITTSPAVTLSPTSLTFASQTTGSTSAAQTVTLTNSGTAALSITSISASGDFAETQTCGGSVATGANCTISVTFTPTAPGARTGTLTVTDNASGSPQTVSLSGTGTVAAPAVTLSPTSLTFAAETDGSISAAQTITLTNSGAAPLSIASITASANFAETNTCGSGVAAGTSCTISVTFTPTTGGNLTGTVTVTDNASGSPESAALSGAGSTVTITAPSSGLTISSAGGSATANIQLSPVGGFSGTVNLACSVSYQGTETPTDAPTCNLNPAQEQVSNSSSTSATLTVSTTAATSSAVRTGNPWLRGGEGVLAALLLFGAVPRKKWRRIGFLTVLGIIAFGGVFGCGGGSSVVNNPPSNPGTTTGSYIVAVTATSGTATASAQIPLSVQ